MSPELLVYALGARAEHKTVGKKGIRHQNIFYQSPELAAHLGSQVNLRIDSNNIRQAYAFNPIEQYLCIVRDSEHAPLSAEELKEACKGYQKHRREIKNPQTIATRYLPKGARNPD